jgi:hypothetical protein
VRGGGVKSKTMIESPFEVAKDPFDNEEVRFTWIMHVKANLLNSVGYFGPSESHVLKSAG